MTTLPTYTTQSAIDLSWTGSDGQGVGIASYDVQVRDDDGPWQDLLTYTQQTSTTSQGQDGHAYGFRVRARDFLGNVGAYPNDPQALTTVDTAAPTVSISGPSSIKEGASATFSVSAADTASGISALSWQVTGSLPVSFAGLSFTIPSPLLEAGQTNVFVTAVDGVGRKTTRQASLTVESSSGTGARNPKLHIGRAQVRGRRVTLFGTVNRRATGFVSLASVERARRPGRRGGAGGRSQRKSRAGEIRKGRWSVGARVPERGTYKLTVRYAGDERFAADRASDRVRVRR